MKKTPILLLALPMVLALCAYSQNAEPAQTESPAQTENPSQTEPSAQNEETSPTAASAIFPVVVLFLFTQKYFVESIATTRVKG